MHRSGGQTSQYLADLLMAFQVSVDELDAHFDVGEDETIVEAASAQGIPFPFSCHSGTCGTCKSRLHRGRVRLLEYSKFALTDAERAGGLILACCAIPESDCALSLAAQSPIAARRMTCSVMSISDATHDIKIVRLQANNEPLSFLPGQYADITFGALPSRNYSMANIPENPTLEFHVRLSKQGIVSNYVHSTLSVGEQVELKAPYGSSYLRDKSRSPILAIAGGSGLAPIKSIMDACLNSDVTRDIHCYFGVRTEADLYYTDYLHELARKRLIRFTPVLSEPGGGKTAYREGFLCDVIAADFTALKDFDVYAAGPPLMVDTCLNAVTSLGLPASKYHADAFI
jgi:naphthalene 1,2-dioxygenase ferredoxin reductase component